MVAISGRRVTKRRPVVHKNSSFTWFFGKLEESRLKLKVEYIPIDDLTPYENNAKIHTEEQIEQIKQSIEEFGMNDPVGIWGKENLIVEGHGRLMACRELGMNEIPVIRLDELTDDQRRAYTLVHNQTTMNTGFDANVLGAELGEITIDLSEYGFEDFDIDAEDFGTDFELADGEKNEICSVTFTLHERQKELIDYALERVQEDVTETFGNTNKNGNALYEVVRQWAEQKK